MPNTVNRFLNVPNTGDLPGAWGTTAVNYNMSALDGTLGGFATLALSSATTIILGLPAGAAFTPGSGPTQSENALLKFSGTLTGHAVIKVTMPGYFIVHNTCSGTNTFVVQLAPASGTGTAVCAPPGRKCHMFFDGTNVDYVNMPEVGSALDLHQSSVGYPVWMSSCSVIPYLLKDGTVYSAATYPALAQVLGSTFGGNGSTTFGVPDERNRMRIAVDPSGSTGRITSGVSGIAGATMGAAGGSQSLTAHTHTINFVSGTENQQHTHQYFASANNNSATAGGGFPCNAGGGGTSTGTEDEQHNHNITGTSDSSGAGGSQNMPPSIVSFAAFIKT
jgi:microcystin-dependent protein